MKMYLAGGGGKIFETLFDKCKVQNRLLSYYSCYADDLDEKVKNNLSILDKKRSYFLDSGGYSARAMGVDIDIKKYHKFLTKYGKQFTVVANLDVGTYDNCKANQKYLETSGANVLPVFHYQEYLTQKYRYEIENLCKNYEYVAIGGVAGSVTGGKMLDQYLTHCFHYGLKYKTKFHGFGMTSPTLLSDFPFYSADSTSWMQGGRYGTIVENISITKQKSYAYREKENLEKVLGYGLSIKQLHNYKERDMYNIKQYLKVEENITRLWKKRGLEW
ncbi:MAG: hypothetical protein KAT66_00555 [Candidatus Lokiarchaeota archaeon]|nr:hypothetical protein [Candidatus Lokiarchaeota archaeon]